MKRVIVVNPRDTVATLLNHAEAGDSVHILTAEGKEAGTVKIAEPISKGHKVALLPMKEADMDINAGTIIEGRESIEEVGSRIFREIIQVASGKKTKLEGLVPGVFDIYRPDPRLDSLAGISRRL
jgi:altronate dehydratase large subunit